MIVDSDATHILRYRKPGSGKGNVRGLLNFRKKSDPE